MSEKVTLPPQWVYWLIAGLGLVGVCIAIAYALWKRKQGASEQ